MIEFELESTENWNRYQEAILVDLLIHTVTKNTCDMDEGYLQSLISIRKGMGPLVELESCISCIVGDCISIVTEWIPQIKIHHINILLI